jgi:hypothetical protein
VSEPRHSCLCCGKRTLQTHQEWEVCTVCGWEDDPVYYKNPEICAGANGMSLSAARDQYDRTGKRVR